MKMLKKIGTFGGGLLLAGGSLLAQTAPTSLDGFSTTATGYISTGTTVAIAAATLALGWVGFRIVKRFTAGATGR